MYYQQTGYPQQQQQQPLYGQQQQQPPGFLQPQQTRLAPQATGFMQPQQTGFAQGYMQAQPTGYLPQQQPRFANPPPMPPMPAMNASFLSAAPTGYQQQPQFTQQQTYFAPQVPQMFTQTFLPANPTSFVTQPAQMQFAQPSYLNQGQSLQQVYQQQNVQQHGQAQVKVPWALSADERKNYDAIFRAWDQQGTGFISGAMAKEVFGQSGIERDELMQIWNLADTENRGKLNLAEFHVAMGLIYRRLNGNPIPAQLPPELVPPSARDLDQSVDFLKDLLRNDTNVRSTAGNFSDSSRGKTHSLHEGPSRPAHKDATAYKHEDASAASTYKPSSRHLDRSRIRANNDKSPTSDLEEIRRQLDDSQSMLDKAKAREAEDDALAQEKDDLLYQIRRIQSDIEQNSKGRRTDAKEQERRRLDRELDRLKYENLPALERKIEDREREKARKKRRDAVDRDQRNNNYSRFEDRSRSRYDDYDRERPSSSRRYKDDESDDEPKGYERGTFQTKSRRSTSRSRSPPAPRRAPASPPPRREERKPAPAPPPPREEPKPAPSPKPAAMSAEERAAYIKAEAAKRVQERLAALGIAAPSPEPVAPPPAPTPKPVATGDQEADDRARQRQIKLERERAQDEAKEQEVLEQAEKEIQRMSDDVTRVELGQRNPDKEAAAQGAREALDQQEAALAEREAALLKAQADRKERLRRLEEEERAAQLAEEEFQKRKQMFAQPPAPAPARPGARKAPPPPPAAKRVPAAPPQGASAPPPATAREPTPPPPRAPSPPPRGPSPKAEEPKVEAPSSTNPFHRVQTPASQASTPALGLGDNNPFNRNRTPAPAATPQPTVPRPKAPVAAGEEDWDVPTEKYEDDSSDDDEPLSGRAMRENLAKNLFGGIMPPIASRPPSAGATSRPQTPAPPAASAPPPPPGPPAAPPAPASVEPIVPPNRGALLGQIQGGLKLKKAQTIDKSKPLAAGTVLGGGDPAPAPTPRAPSPPVIQEPHKRESVDWYNGIASQTFGSQEPATQPIAEEPEEERPLSSNATVDAAAGGALAAAGLSNGQVENVDYSSSSRGFTLHAYAANDRPEDLDVEANVIVLTRRALDNEDWLYGTVEGSGLSGWLPANYVSPIVTTIQARATYDYAATSSDEIDLQEGQTLTVIDQSEENWWKAEHAGRVVMVPAAYLEEAAHAPVTPTPALLGAPFLGNSLASSASTADSADEHELERDAERTRVLQAAGVLSRNKTRNRPGRPRTSASDEQPSSPIRDTTEDAYDRWVALQHDLPPMPAMPSRQSLALPETPPEPSIASPSSNRNSGFFSRIAAGFGRTSPVPNLEERPAPQITIVRQDLGAGVQPTGPTWSSFIGENALAEIPVEERKRQESIFELIATESAYVKNLQLVVNQFFFKLQSVLDDKALNVVFANIEDLLLYSTTLLSDLEARQKDSRLYILNIGDILEKHIDGLSVYRPYCSNQANAARTLEDLKANDPQVRDVLATSKIDDLDLEHFLLQPMQRLTRYPLLFSQIIKYTDDSSEESRQLKRCLAVAESVLRATNDLIRNQQDALKLQELSETLEFKDSDVELDLTTLTKTGQRRRIIKEGPLAKRHSSKKIYAYLLSDMFLLTIAKSNLIYRNPIPLEECRAEAHHDDESFTITHLGTEIAAFRAPSSRAATRWRDEINAAGEACLDASRKLARGPGNYF